MPRLTAEQVRAAGAHTEILDREYILALDDTGERSAVDEKARTVRVIFSTDSEEVERWFGLEKLSHDPAHVRLERLRKAGPVLVNHDRDKLVGAPDSVEICPDGKGRAVVLFGPSDYATEILRDVAAGVRKTLSVRYKTHHMTLLEKRDDGPDLFLVDDWEPYEFSFEVLPGDINAQVGRQAGLDQERNETMSDKKTPPVDDSTRQDNVQPAPPAAPVVDVQRAEMEAVTGERKRTQDINGLAQRVGHLFDATEMAKEFINGGKSTNEFRQAVLERMEKVETPTPGPSLADTSVGMSRKDMDQYSLLRLAAAQLSGDWSKAGLEKEASRAVAEQTGQDPQGDFLPYDILEHNPMERAMDSTDSGALIATNLMAGSMIDLLRNNSVVSALGATVMPGLVGDQDIPKMTAGSAGTWINNETYAGSDEDDPVIGAVSLSGKTLRLAVPLTRKILKNSTPAGEMLIRGDLARAAGEGVDKVAILGGGTNEPQGIIGYTGVEVVAMGDNGAALDWASVVAIETALANGKSLGGLGYLGNSKTTGAMKTTVKDSDGNGLGFLMDRDGKVNGYPCHESESMPCTMVKGTSGAVCSGLIFGAWKALLVGLWGPLDVLADRSTLGSKGGLMLYGFQDADVNLRYTEAFAYIADILTA